MAEEEYIRDLPAEGSPTCVLVIDTRMYVCYEEEAAISVWVRILDLLKVYYLIFRI